MLENMVLSCIGTHVSANTTIWNHVDMSEVIENDTQTVLDPGKWNLHRRVKG